MFRTRLFLLPLLISLPACAAMDEEGTGGDGKSDSVSDTFMAGELRTPQLHSWGSTDAIPENFSSAAYRFHRYDVVGSTRGLLPLAPAFHIEIDTDDTFDAVLRIQSGDVVKTMGVDEMFSVSDSGRYAVLILPPSGSRSLIVDVTDRDALSNADAVVDSGASYSIRLHPYDPRAVPYSITAPDMVEGADAWHLIDDDPKTSVTLDYPSETYFTAHFYDRSYVLAFELATAHQDVVRYADYSGAQFRPHLYPDPEALVAERLWVVGAETEEITVTFGEDNTWFNSTATISTLLAYSLWPDYDDKPHIDLRESASAN